MPARDGTGPAGQGSRTGRALGNCESTGEINRQIPNTSNTLNRPYRQNRGIWESTVGRLFGRRRVNRNNQR